VTFEDHEHFLSRIWCPGIDSQRNSSSYVGTSLFTVILFWVLLKCSRYTNVIWSLSHPIHFSLHPSPTLHAMLVSLITLSHNDAAVGMSFKHTFRIVFIPTKPCLCWETEEPITKGSHFKQFLQQTCTIFLAEQKEICRVVTFFVQVRKLVVRKALNFWPILAELGCVPRDPTWTSGRTDDCTKPTTHTLSFRTL
jgi:hypothetical protein